MARSRDSTVGRRGMNCVEVQIIKVDTASMTTNLSRDVPPQAVESQHHLDSLVARAECALRLCTCNNATRHRRPDMRPAGGTFMLFSVVRVLGTSPSSFCDMVQGAILRTKTAPTSRNHNRRPAEALRLRGGRSVRLKRLKCSSASSPTSTRQSTWPRWHTSASFVISQQNTLTYSPMSSR
jgi:hypothetical protein